MGRVAELGPLGGITSHMKTFLQSWWRGIGVIGLYLAISIAAGALCFLVDLLPERARYIVGPPLLFLLVPPLAFWTFRWIYPEAVEPKPVASGERSSL